MTFDRVAASCSRFAGRPAMVLLCAALAVGGIVAFVMGNDRFVNGCNLAISIATLMLLPVLQASQNRDSLAMHVKLDAITPDDRLNRAEELDAAAIESLRG